MIKTYYYCQSPEFGDFIFEKSEGYYISYILDVKSIGKSGRTWPRLLKRRNKRIKVVAISYFTVSGEIRTVNQEVIKDSFFSFFSPTTQPEEIDLPDEEQAALNEAMEADYELGEEFKNKLIPHAIDWFTGMALQYENQDFGDVKFLYLFLV